MSVSFVRTSRESVMSPMFFVAMPKCPLLPNLVHLPGSSPSAVHSRGPFSFNASSKFAGSACVQRLRNNLFISVVRSVFGAIYLSIHLSIYPCICLYILSHPILSYYILSHLILSYLILSYLREAPRIPGEFQGIPRRPYSTVHLVRFT